MVLNFIDKIIIKKSIKLSKSDLQFLYLGAVLKFTLSFPSVDSLMFSNVMINDYRIKEVLKKNGITYLMRAVNKMEENELMEEQKRIENAISWLINKFRFKVIYLNNITDSNYFQHYLWTTGVHGCRPFLGTCPARSSSPLSRLSSALAARTPYTICPSWRMTQSRISNTNSSLNIPALTHNYDRRVHLWVTCFHNKAAYRRVVLEKLLVAFLTCDSEGQACVNFNDHLF